MSVGALIVSAVSDLAPCKARIYTGREKRYFVYDITDDRGDDWGDDSPEHTHYWVRLKFYYPQGENQNSIKKEVRRRLKRAGFSYAQISEVSFPEDGIDGIEWTCDFTEESEEE